MIARTISSSKFLKLSSLVSLGTLIGVVVSFIADIVTARKFGIGLITDIFFISLTIPNLIKNLLETNIQRVIVPNLITKKKELSENFSNYFLSVFLSFFLVFSFISFILIISSKVWIKPLASGFGENEIDQVFLNLIPLSIMLIPMSFNCLLRALLNTNNNFFIPALDRFIQQLLVLIFIILFSNKIGILSVSWGYFFGSFLYFIILIFPSIKLLNIKLHTVRINLLSTKSLLLEVAKLSTTSMSRNIYTIFERTIATSLGEGVVSALAYALKIVNSLLLITGNGFISIAAPELSRKATSNDFLGWKQSLTKFIKLIFAIDFPITILIFVFSDAMIRILFKSNVDESNISFSIHALKIYSPIIIFSGLEQIFINSFFSKSNSKIANFSILLSSIIQCSLTLLLPNILSAEGLPWATTLTAIFSLFFCMYFSYKNFSYSIENYFFDLMKIFPAGILLFFVGWIFNIFCHSYITNLVLNFQNILICGILGVFSIMIYLLVGFLFPPYPFRSIAK